MEARGLDAERRIAELRRRLYEAEETLRAIREGEVDALVIRDAGRDEIFTLESGPEPYRVFMEAMDLGAAAFDVSGRLLYVNAALARLLDTTPENLRAAGVLASLGAAAADIVGGLLRGPAEGRRNAEIAVGEGRATRRLQVSAAPMRIGPSAGTALTFTDITERIRVRAAEESERAAHAVIASVNEAVIVCDTSGRVTHANAAAAAITVGSPVGLMLDDAIPLEIAGAGGLMPGSEVAAIAIGGNAVQGIEASAPQAPRARELLISAAPLRVGDGEISGCVVTMVDLTTRKALEKQQLLLMGELDHRVKNTLALVLSIANRTATTEETVHGFQEAFSGRIQALAATHNILAERSWSSVSVGEVLAQELGPYVPAGQRRLSLVGADLRILPRAAIALGLVLHELVTNAVKHGALSSPGGGVEVRFVDRPEQPFVGIEWSEHGGPPVMPPARSGFGQTVITRSLQYTQHGGATLEYPPEGLRCQMRVPRADVLGAA